MRILITTLLAAAMLGGCAAAPRLAHEGSLDDLRGQPVGLQAGQASPADADLATAVGAAVLDRLQTSGAAPGAVSPRYLVQVTIASAPAGVGVSVAAGPQVTQGWRGEPVKLRPWNKRAPLDTATLVVLDAASGRTIAWSSVRAQGRKAPELADLLVAALAEPKKG
ncbi:MAG: hypothetical protein J7521_10085 [Caulobacter sp.]|nr:hypothetical protein [Caulobacter sp.]